jgi:GGDEF domain-containing protein
MRAIGWLWAATVTWLFVIPSLVPERGTIAIGPEASAFGAAAAVLFVAVPVLRRLDLRWTLLLLLPLFLAVRFAIGEGVGQIPLREALELGYVGAAIVLATGLGRRMLCFEEALEELAAGHDDERAESFDVGQEDIFREIRRARRYERPLALMTLSASGVDAPAGGSLAPEVLREITRRYAAAQVGRLLVHETDAAAVVTQRGDQFVVLLPETELEAARHAAQRLTAEAAARWGLDLHCGIATFPDQEVTFEGLLERAEAELRTLERAPSTGRAREQRRRVRGIRIARAAEPREIKPRSHG